jgi:hypothetical protein
VSSFVAHHLSGTGVTFTSAQMEDLHEKSGGRPRDVRSAAARLYELTVARADQV